MAPPTRFTNWLFGYSNRAQTKGKSVEEEQFSRHFVTESSDVTDCQERGEIAHDTGQRADDAELRAIVAILIVEGVAHEAPIAGLVGHPAAEQPDLALELRRCRRNQRNPEPMTGIRYRQSRREIVAAIQDHIVPGEQMFGVASIDALAQGMNPDCRIDRPRE